MVENSNNSSVSKKLNVGKTSKVKLPDKKKLLVVEDDEITIEILGLFLLDSYELEFAINAQEAIEKVKQNDYAAILLDINLGRGKNGLHVVNEIRELKGKTSLPIIAQTAFAMKGDKEAFLEAGCDYYIAKPFSKDELKAILKQAKI